MSNDNIDNIASCRIISNRQLKITFIIIYDLLIFLCYLQFIFCSLFWNSLV